VAAIDTPTYFAITFAPSGGLINAVRRFVLQFFEHMLGSGEECSRVALATHELLENAVQFCSGTEVSLRVAIAPLGSHCLITIRTRNLATVAHADRLRQRVAWLSGSDALLRYTTAMNEALDGKGGLGLARIRAEADMDLIVEVERDEVDMRAQTRVSLRR
jgi:hypothetical protein